MGQLESGLQLVVAATSVLQPARGRLVAQLRGDLRQALRADDGLDVARVRASDDAVRVARVSSSA